MSWDDDPEKFAAASPLQHDEKHTPSTASTPPLADSLLSPDLFPDELEHMLSELQNFVDKVDPESPAVVDTSILMAMVGHSSAEANEDTESASALSTSVGGVSNDVSMEASVLISAASRLLGLQTDDNNSSSGKSKVEFAGKVRTVEEQASPARAVRTKQAKVVSPNSKQGSRASDSREIDERVKHISSIETTTTIAQSANRCLPLAQYPSSEVFR